MNDKFNQEIFKAIAKSKNKHTQQTNVDSVLDQILKLLEIKESRKHSSRIK